ncbi:MAG TPA: MgtC/SapB family protein [Wenzhouxiangella sp.]|nr:MgtC/SapB family protein [Wenzhouxiangella sp.]
MNPEIQDFVRLAVALAIGLLVGIERGWQYREVEEGQRVAGLRTYSLIGLVGGAVGFISQDGGYWLIGLVFLGLAIASATAYVITTRAGQDFGITSEVAAMATYLFGVLAGTGEMALAAAATIVMAVLLGYKERLHGLLNRLKRKELTAGLTLLLISVVLLPILPNEGFGPWQAFNPYVIWLLVVLIAGISFLGYIAIRIAGPSRGIVFSGLFGGMASSTATTLALSRIAAREPKLSSVLAAGILLACGSMIARMMIVASLIHLPLIERLWLPALLLLGATLAPVGLYLHYALRRPTDIDKDQLMRNPVELRSALLFGALLSIIMMLGKALSEWAGSAGLWALAAASGLADVDAITLSLARMSSQGIALEVAVVGIFIAASVNSLVKGTMGLVIGGRSLGWRLLVPLGAGAALALAAAIFQFLTQAAA